MRGRGELTETEAVEDPPFAHVVRSRVQELFERQKDRLLPPIATAKDTLLYLWEHRSRGSRLAITALYFADEADKRASQREGPEGQPTRLVVEVDSDGIAFLTTLDYAEGAEPPQDQPVFDSLVLTALLEALEDDDVTTPDL